VKRALAVAALYVALEGCLIIPHHLAAPGSRLEPDEGSLAVLGGAPTREQVLLRLGEPDWTLKEQRVLVYTWRVATGTVVLAFAKGEYTVTDHQQYLLVEFDERGVLRRWERTAALEVDVVDSW